MPAKPKADPNDLPDFPDEEEDVKPKKKDKSKDKTDDDPKSKNKDKNKDKENDVKEKKEKKKGSPIVPILVLLIIIGGIVAVLVLNLFNIREQYVMPYLRRAPLVGSLMPTAPPTEDIEEAGTDSGLSSEEMNSQITALNYQIQKLEADLKTATDQNAQDAETIRVLRAYEAQAEEYRQIKAQFDALIANGDPEAYAKFFESISPENADRLYKEVIVEIQYTADEKKMANIYSNMSEDAAAEGLEQLLTTDSALVVRILRSMDAVHVAAIMNEMTAASRATITRMMAPTPVPVTPVQTAPPIPTPVPAD